MDDLRWILLVFGVLLIAAIYGLGRMKRRHAHQRVSERWFGQDNDHDFSMAPRPTEDGDHYRDALADLNSLMSEKRRSAEADADIEPHGAHAMDETLMDTEESGAAGDGSDAATAEVAVENREPAPAADAGSDNAAREERLIVLYLKAPADHVFMGPALFEALDTAGLGLGDMGIYHDKDEQGAILFSVANLFEPGTLATDDAEQFSTRGLALFMQLPGPVDEIQAFERLLAKSEFIAERIGGELHDDRHEPLDGMAVEHLRSILITD